MVEKPRTKLINFRVTAEEFAQLTKVVKDRGGRSNSDFVRQVVIQACLPDSRWVTADEVRKIFSEMYAKQTAEVDEADLMFSDTMGKGLPTS